jgi:hypothetical protein
MNEKRHVVYLHKRRSELVEFKMALGRHDQEYFFTATSHQKPKPYR